MATLRHIATTLALMFCLASWSTAQAQMPALDVAIDSDHVRFEASAQEMRVEVYAPSGEMIFDSGAVTDQAIEWKMRGAKGERVADGVYLVTIQLKTATGQVRKRIEQVVVGRMPQAGARQQSPQAAQATITGSGTANRIAKFTGASTIGDSGIIASAGKIGIGTTAPSATLTVVGALSSNAALSATNDATNGIGVKGSSANDGGVGVKGTHAATTGVTPGVKGETNSTADNAVAVLGVVNPTSAGDKSVAVKGINNDTSLLGCGVCGTPIGVWGEQAKNGYGVYGFAPDGVGVYGNSNTGTGMYAQSSMGPGVSGNSSSGDGVVGSSSSGYAGHFLGNAKVEGSLEVTNGLTVTGGCTGCSMTSDQNLKANFSLINPRQVLNRLAALPIKAWNYKSDASSVRHVGPMAQDFRAAFNLGVDDKHIDMIDANGVTMAAIQGLYQMMQEKDRQIEQLQSQVVQLQRTVKQQRKVRR